MKDRCKVIFYVDNLLTFLVIESDVALRSLISPHKVRNATVIPYRAFSIFATFCTRSGLICLVLRVANCTYNNGYITSSFIPRKQMVVIRNYKVSNH